MEIRLELYEDGELCCLARFSVANAPELGKEIIVDFNDPEVRQECVGWTKPARGTWFCDVHELVPLEDLDGEAGFLVRYFVVDEVPANA